MKIIFCMLTIIQRLANNLVPIPSPKAQEKDEVTKKRILTSNPFSMELKPLKPLNKKKMSLIRI